MVEGRGWVWKGLKDVWRVLCETEVISADLTTVSLGVEYDLGSNVSVIQTMK